MWVSRWQMSTEYLSGASNYTQMNLSELVWRLTLELVSALHDSSAVRWRLVSRRKKKFLECSYADKMIICCLCCNKQHAINFMRMWEINIPVLSGDGKLSEVQLHLLSDSQPANNPWLSSRALLAQQGLLFICIYCDIRPVMTGIKTHFFLNHIPPKKPQTKHNSMYHLNMV